MRWLVLLLLSGCAASPAADWQGDARFSLEERARIEEGTAWLNAQVGRPAPVIAWTLDASDLAAPGTIRREHHGASGFCEAGTVYLDPETAGTYLDGLAAHEMAHCALGLVDGYRHGDAPTDGIMRVLSPMRWTESEQAQWEALR